MTHRSDNRLPVRAFFAAFLCLLSVACGDEAAGPAGVPAVQDDFGALRRKAMAHDRWLENWHTPAYGSHLHVEFADTSRARVGSYTGHGDSCIWTGTYMASQALRYQATGDAQARANVIRSAAALSRHLRVTGRPGFIARYVGPASDPGHARELEGCPADEDCHLVDSGPYRGDFWKGNTSRDQYTGWFLGMALGYELVAEQAMREQIAADVTLVLDRLLEDNWIIVDVDGQPTGKAPIVLPMMQMTWSLIGHKITGERRFLEVFEFWAKPHRRKQLRLTNIGFTNRYTQHYGLNLAHENYLNLLRLSRPYADSHKFLVSIFREQTHHWVDLQHNPWYTAVYLAEGLVDDPAAFQEHKEQILEDLTDFPAPPKFRYAMFPPAAEPDPVSIFLHDLQQQFPPLEDIIGTVNVQAREAYPVRHQCFSGFIFQRNMWALECDDKEDNPASVASGHDYLAAYWLASAYGILRSTD